MGCERTTRIDDCYTPYPFQFQEESVTWLKQCEIQIPPSNSVIFDFDRLKRKYKKDKDYYDSVNR